MKRILIVGGGPAGYVAAGRAAQLGAAVTLVETREIGGTCLNRGCIPTKALIAGAERLRQVRDASAFGIRTGEVEFDFAAFMDRKERVTSMLRDGVDHLLKARKVEVITGWARLSGAHTLALSDGRELHGDAIIIATGSEPVRLGLFDWSDPRIMTSDEALRIESVPETLAIVGGGAIGCEFASLFATLGTEVFVIEMMSQLIPGEGMRASKTLQQAFKRTGIDVSLAVRVESAAPEGEDIALHLDNGRVISAARVLVAVGRRPLTSDAGLTDTGVRLDERGYVVTDRTLRTSVADVFAAGDVTGPPMLAHWAYHQGVIAAENAVTGASRMLDERVVPSVAFSVPEVASCGMSEERAATENVPITIAHVRLNSNSKAVIEGNADGFVRIVCEAESGRILGASVLGPHAAELIHELALATHAGLTLESLAGTIHAHPTLSEAIGEAANAALGHGIHSL
ncbi:MAG: dihydrolipoyl dehydrogenase [Thermoleophilia bacterium]